MDESKVEADKAEEDAHKWRQKARRGGWWAFGALVLLGFGLGALAATIDAGKDAPGGTVGLAVYGVFSLVLISVGGVAQWTVVRTPRPGEVDVPGYVRLTTGATWFRSRLTYAQIIRPGREDKIVRVTGRTFDVEGKTYVADPSARRWNPDYLPKAFLLTYQEGNPAPIPAKGEPVRYTSSVLHTFGGDYFTRLFKGAMKGAAPVSGRVVAMLVGALVVGAVTAYLLMGGGADLFGGA